MRLKIMVIILNLLFIPSFVVHPVFAGDSGYSSNGYSNGNYKEKAHYDNGKMKHKRGYISQHLPKWINVDVEIRHRFESWDNLDLKESKDDNDGFNLWRTRVGITLKPTDQMKIYYLFQDSRISNDGIFDQPGKNKTKYENWADTKKLYLKYKHLFSVDPIGLEGVTVVLGRQPLKYGKQRLLGDPNWGNIGQAFDAVKAKLHFHDLDVDLFGGMKVDKKIPREHDDLYEGGAKDRIAGYYAKYKGIENMKVEQYLLQRKTNKSKSFGPSASGELDEYTAGARVSGKVGESGFDYDFEAAYQWGDMDDLDISAWMAVAVLGYTFDHEWDPRIAFEIDYASGDSDSSDGERNTFDNLHPTNHALYGYMDRASLQNIKIYSLQSSAKPMDKLKLQTNLHFIYLDTPNDYLYDAGRKALRTSTSSDYSRYVGNELDFTAKYKLTEYANLLMGYSHFFAGEYLKDTGADDDGDYAYVQTTVNF